MLEHTETAIVIVRTIWKKKKNSAFWLPSILLIEVNKN